MEDVMKLIRTSCWLGHDWFKRHTEEKVG